MYKLRFNQKVNMFEVSIDLGRDFLQQKVFFSYEKFIEGWNNKENAAKRSVNLCGSDALADMLDNYGVCPSLLKKILYKKKKGNYKITLTKKKKRGGDHRSGKGDKDLPNAVCEEKALMLSLLMDNCCYKAIKEHSCQPFNDYCDLWRELKGIDEQDFDKKLEDKLWKRFKRIVDNV